MQSDDGQEELRQGSFDLGHTTERVLEVGVRVCEGDVVCSCAVACSCAVVQCCRGRCQGVGGWGRTADWAARLLLTQGCEATHPPPWPFA